MILELIRNRSFTCTTGDSKRSRLRRLRNGAPQKFVLAVLLFNIYMCNLPSTTSKMNAYADDMGLLHSSRDRKGLDGTLSQYMATLSVYLKTRRLKLSHAKKVTAAFYLHNRETKRELKVPWGKTGQITYIPPPSRKIVPSTIKPRHASEATCGYKKCSVAKTLFTAALSLFYLTAECCAPDWCCSAHIRLIDVVLKNAFCIVTGCLRPTPTDHLPILSDIQPAIFVACGQYSLWPSVAPWTQTIFYSVNYLGHQLCPRGD